MLARLAAAAEHGGARAIRAGGVGGVTDIAAVRAAVRCPVIGLTKEGDGPVYITPTVAAVRRCAESGADLVAVDGTGGSRVDGSTLAEQIDTGRRYGVPVMADVSTLAEGVAAMTDGADLVSTTLAGYTEGSRRCSGPDLTLVGELRRELPGAFLVAEGRYHSPADVRAAFDLGADAVVVGTAITDVSWITARFAAASGD